MHSKSDKTRLALIRPTEQQLPVYVQSPQVKSRYKGGGAGETVCTQEEGHGYLSNFPKQGK